MNDPLTKYAHLSSPKNLVFFNYHEYLVSEYEPLDNNQGREQVHGSNDSKPALVVNHFPNPYTIHGGDLFWRTRIVRIPRIYDQSDESYMVPQFSTYVPGHEPAALTNDTIHEFEPAGYYKGYAFGITSLTPLVPQWLSEGEFESIVKTINGLIYETTAPQRKTTWLESALDFFTGTLYSTVFTKFLRDSNFERSLKKVDEYIGELNSRLGQKHNDLQVIPMLKSAMLSLDFQIPLAPENRVFLEPTREHQQESQSSISATKEQDKESERQ